MVMFMQATGINMLHVPYKGIQQAMIDAIANEIQLSFAVFPVGKPHVDGGRLRAIGVTTAAVPQAKASRNRPLPRTARRSGD